MTQKYQREIEEILDQVNSDLPSSPERSSVKTVIMRKKVRQSRTIPRLPTSKFLGLGIVLLFVSVAMTSFGLPLAEFVGLLGVLLFLAGYVVYFMRPKSGNTEKRWRGQIIDDRGNERSDEARRRFWER